MSKRWLVSVWIAVIVILGCAPQNIFRDVMDEATSQIGQEIADRVASAYLEDIGPRIIRSYSVGLMQMMFYQGGFYGEELSYEPSEYTIWTSDDSPYGEVIERAFLKRTDDGMEWWRIEVFGEDPDGEGDDMHLIMEALFEPMEDRRYIREMFVKFPDDDEPTDLEITEDDAERWVIRAERWSDEEMERALVGTEEVTVPAGTFTADRYRADAADSEVADREDILTEWWQADGQVPGSVVKVEQSERDDDEVFQTLVLDSYGTGADESVLGAF